MKENNTPGILGDNVLVFGDYKVGYGVAKAATGGEYLVLQKLDIPYEDRGTSNADTFLQFKSRAAFQDWINNLQELANCFSE